MNRWTGLFLAWLLAGVATLGALFIGEVMGQMPCVLCWYQRIAMFPLAIILGIGVYKEDRDAWRYALPLSIIGLLIAGYHSLMYSGVIPAPIQPCTATGPSCSGDGMLVAGIPIPYLSAAAFAGIAVFLIPFTRRSHEA